MSDTLAGLLEQAVEAFERHEDAEAVQRLREAWSQSRAGRIALLAERLSPTIPPEAGPSEWEALLQKLLVGMRRPGGGTWLPDPRYTPALRGLAALPMAREDEGFRLLREVSAALRDPRLLEPLRALHASLPPGSRKARTLGADLELLAREAPPPLSAEASALCDVLEGAMARRQEAGARRAALWEELLARVAAQPGDDGPRLVLADHLLEQGDPLGELMALQCQPEPDEARIAALLEKHRAAWEALLGPGVEPGGVRFERGLPVAVRMKLPPGLALPPPGPLWCTVRALDWSWAGDEAQVDWLAHPHLRGVTALKHLRGDLVARLSTHPLPVRELVTRAESINQGGSVFAPLQALPHLVRVEVQNARWSDVLTFSTPANSLASRLERFEASEPGRWSLVVTPAAEVPVEATLLRSMGSGTLGPAIRCAANFSTRAVRIRSQVPLAPSQRLWLERDAARYARVEWDVPPGGGDASGA